MIAERCEERYIEQPLSGFWQRFGNLLQHMGGIITRWAQLAQQRQQLREMDDRQLKDISLSHADVERITGRRLWDDPLVSNEKIDQRHRS